METNEAARPETVERPDVTITLTRYAEDDSLVAETLDSLARQRGVVAEVIFLDQRFDPSFAKAVEARTNGSIVFTAAGIEARGLSFARNEGVRRARSNLVLFIDPDAVADPDWAQRLAAALAAPGVAVAGARIIPRWRGPAPLLARSRVVLDQYSLLDWGETTIDAARVVGAGFGVNRAFAPDETYFDESLGRRDGKLFGGEESDLCARLLAKGGRIVYCGGARVEHQILPERLSWRWIFRRLYYAGLGRARAGGAPSPSQRPGLWDWLLLPAILPPYALGYARARFFS